MKRQADSWLDILRFFPPEIRSRLGRIPGAAQQSVIEIRLRTEQPLELNCGIRSWLVSAGGELVEDPERAWVISSDEMRKAINSLTTGSYYALEDEIAQGYLALPGGHRAGVTGQALIHSGRVKTIRNLSSVNFRIARAHPGIARPILPFLWKDGRLLKTLIISPPAAGKTTLLREIIRELSFGVPGLNIPGQRLAVVDERSELAGSYLGVPQLDLGPRTDVLDGCPKEEGVYLVLRAMNPQIIATDEIGREKDQQMIADVINAGVSFITTAHARNLTEAMLRPGLRRILENGSVDRLIVLSNRLGPGTIESVKSGAAGPELFNHSMG